MKDEVHPFSLFPPVSVVRHRTTLCCGPDRERTNDEGQTLVLGPQAHGKEHMKINFDSMWPSELLRKTHNATANDRIQ